MRTFDLAPLYRSTVGFDRLFSMLDGFEAAPGYPPYNIERTGENDYRITVAVAGFGENELSLEAKENTLTIKGEKQVKQDTAAEVLYQGIAGRAFERRFQLAEHVEVRAAKLENGLLHVELEQIVPEEKKPRRISINAPALKTIEGSAKAA
jgi:molecular chaperone IbpA